MKKKNRKFTIGELVFDYSDDKMVWARVKNVGKDNVTLEKNNIPSVEDKITDDNLHEYDKDCPNEWASEKENVYQVDPDHNTFNGHLLCTEHNQNVNGFDYPYFCPAREENVYNIETD
jgi:hypothetical protein